MRYALTDHESAAIKPMLPDKRQANLPRGHNGCDVVDSSRSADKC
jgi:hypothetical protein